MSFFPAGGSVIGFGSNTWAWQGWPHGGVAAGGDRLFVRSDPPVGFLLADLAGNGSAAAPAADRVAVHAATLPPDRDPAHSFRVLHTRLVSVWLETDVDSHRFAEATLIDIDAESGTLSAACGQPFLWVRDGGRWERWQVPSCGLIGIPGLSGLAQSATRPLTPGGMLFACTDGLPDAKDANGERFEDLILGTLAGETPAEVLDRVMATARRFVAGEWPSSDTTALCVEW